MLLRRRADRDPFWDDGVGAKRTHTRQQVVALAAFLTAVAACGLTTAAWLRQLGPVTGLLPG